MYLEGGKILLGLGNDHHGIIRAEIGVFQITGIVVIVLLIQGAAQSSGRQAHGLQSFHINGHEFASIRHIGKIIVAIIVDIVVVVVTVVAIPSIVFVFVVLVDVLHGHSILIEMRAHQFCLLANKKIPHSTSSLGFIVFVIIGVLIHAKISGKGRHVDGFQLNFRRSSDAIGCVNVGAIIR